ncbi:MAG: N-acetylmuramoyl-L-alanine amidase [[Clostridium] fimetarium]|nr:N-acetylmuramoyl-L-alanine amidase [Alistipes timonensis]MCM1405509.1 N-acetylmuramoyl-L-alanine amidase [[Clostridium] fimetarium]
MKAFWLKYFNADAGAGALLRFGRGVVAAAALALCSISGAHECAARDFVVVLDPGHGGKDFGAVGKITNEKTIVLDVAKILGSLIDKNLGERVNTVFTRKTDVFIPLSERAAIANKAQADLFISIHVNSVDKRNRNRTTIHGCQVYTLGLHKTAENLAVAKRENAVMELEADHSVKYAGFDPNSLESDIIFELSQNKRLDQSIEFADAVHSELCDGAGRAPKGVRQAGFWVLWATSMPSVLVELDFICNPDSERYLNSDSGKRALAASIYNAFCSYLNTYGESVTGDRMPAAKRVSTGGKERDAAPALKRSAAPPPREVCPEEQAPAEAIPADGPTEWRVQILATGSPLPAGSPQLKGLKDVSYYKEGGMLKYTAGSYGSAKEARKALGKVRKKFPEAFIVVMRGGKRVGMEK